MVINTAEVARLPVESGEGQKVKWKVKWKYVAYIARGVSMVAVSNFCIFSH